MPLLGLLSIALATPPVTATSWIVFPFDHVPKVVMKTTVVAALALTVTVCVAPVVVAITAAVGEVIVNWFEPPEIVIEVVFAVPCDVAVAILVPLPPAVAFVVAIPDESVCTVA